MNRAAHAGAPHETKTKLIRKRACCRPPRQQPPRASADRKGPATRRARARPATSPNGPCLVGASIVARGPASLAARPGCAGRTRACFVAGPKEEDAVRPLSLCCVQVQQLGLQMVLFILFFKKKEKGKKSENGAMNLIIKSLIIHPDYVLVRSVSTLNLCVKSTM